MKNKEIKTVAPKLRFPEFRNTKDWEITVLRAICEIKNGKSNVQDHVENGKYPLFDRSETVKASNNYLFNCEAIILPGEGVRFIPKYYVGKFDLHQRAYALKKFSCFGKFVYYLLLAHHNLIALKAVRSTVLSLRLPILEQFPVIIPELVIEQQKIADCLSSIDDLITSTAKKIEALKAHKKGLMQQLFPAEGEKVPDMRFPEFREAGEWKEKTIYAIGEVVTGNTPSKNEKEFWGGNFVWITAQDFKDKYIYDSVLKLTEKGRKKSKVIPRNSILVTCIASIGLNGINKIECATNQQINSVTCYPDYDYEFVYYAVSCNSDRLKSLAGQTAVPIISKSIFENFVILIPEQKKEQQKIASCLSSLDDLITALSQKLEVLKNHKKGLMQQLFPDMNE